MSRHGAVALDVGSTARERLRPLQFGEFRALRQGWTPEPADPRGTDPTDTADIPDSIDTADTPDSIDTADTPDSIDTADTPDSADPTDSIDTDDDGDLTGAPRHRPRRIRLNRLVQTWVPEPLRDARVDPGRRGALVLLLVAALAAVATAVGVWRDRPVPRPVQPVAMAPVSDSVPAGDTPPGAPGRRGTGTGSSASPGVLGTEPAARGAPAGGGTGAQPPPAPSSAAPAELAVSVTGLVKRPGLVRVPAGSRVADAIAAAGGVTDTADITGLNLAAVLTDGDSVVVGGAVATGSIAGQAPATPGGTGAGTGGTGGGSEKPDPVVDLNTADRAALEELPGVGPVMAGNILSWRETNGGFTSVDQLQEVTGIGPARFAQLQPLVTAGPAP